MADEKKDELKEGQEGETGEYNSGWDEADKLLGGEGSDKPVETDGGYGEGLPEKAPDKAGEPEENKPAASDEDPKEKSLRDTKAWATRLSQENAELKRTIDAFRKGEATKQDVKDAEKAVGDMRAKFDTAKEKFYGDYPESKDVIDPMFEMLFALEKDISELKSSNAQNAEKKKHESAYEYFNTHVRPEVIKVHPDFDSIMTKEDAGKKVSNDEYFEWAERQRPALRFAAMESNDPDDIIEAVTEFKKFKASPDAEAFRQKQKKKIKDKITNTQTLRGGSMPFPAGSVKKGDPEDYNSGWNEADAILKKQGVG